jgi:glycosyltransferase involved in cell wall biosynthesis
VIPAIGASGRRDGLPASVALVFRDFNLTGSIERSVVLQARELAARGIRVGVYCSPRARIAAPEGVVFHDVVPLGDRTSRLGQALDSASFADRATRALRRDRDRYELVEAIGTAAWEHDVVTVHAVTAADQRRWRLEGGEAFRLAGLRSMLAPALRPRIGTRRVIERLQFRRGGVLRAIAVTEEVRDDLVEVHGLSPAVIDVVHYGIDVSSFAARAGHGEMRRWLGIPHAAPLLLFVGGDSFERKGLRNAIEALAGLDDDVHLVVLGSDRHEPFAALACETGVEARVHFAGSSTEPERFYRDADVFVLPTRHEPWGVTIVEAMAAGVPVVATRVARASREVMAAGAGIVVPDAKPRTLATAIGALLADPERRAVMGAAGRRVAWRYDLAREVDARLETYARALRTARAGRPGREQLPLPSRAAPGDRPAASRRR